MLQKLVLRPGVSRENTRYTTEGGWYDCDKIRFRQGSPESIGGWVRISSNTFLGVCRSLWKWLTLSSIPLTGVGTNLKFYIEQGGAYFDVTPIRTARLLANNSLAAVNGSATITVTDSGHGVAVGDYVTFYGATSLGGNITAAVINREYAVATAGSTTYTFTATATANASDTLGGGAKCSTAAQIPVGTVLAVPLTGWGADGWSSGVWGTSATSSTLIRLWEQRSFGEDLIFGYRYSEMYYWNASYSLAGTTCTMTSAAPCVVTATLSIANNEVVSFSTTGELYTPLLPGKVYYVINTSGTTFQLSLTSGGAAINTSGVQAGTHTLSTRGVAISLLGFASAVPTQQTAFLVSDVSRFVIAFGTNDFGGTTADPLLIRWSDQEDSQDWTPTITNQAGSIRLSHGSMIVTAVTTRQEIVVLTDEAVYVLQYVGPPTVWSPTLMADNISIIGKNAAIAAADAVYWMGRDKFYKFDGTAKMVQCNVLRYIFTDFNYAQADQCFAGANEGFDEIWWFYCSAASTTVDRYVVFNYTANIWYYGTMARTAWLDTGTQQKPMAATYLNNLVNHEDGLDANDTGTPTAIATYVTSSEFDIGDGHAFGFVHRVLPDVTFTGSTATSPQVTVSLLALKSSGSGYNNPESVAGTNSASVTRTASAPVESFTGQVNIRIRGRQMSLRVDSNQIGLAWQLGVPRIDVRPDGRAG